MSPDSSFFVSLKLYSQDKRYKLTNSNANIAFWLHLAIPKRDPFSSLMLSLSSVFMFDRLIEYACCIRDRERERERKFLSK